MELPRCKHASERIEGAFFKIIDGQLMMGYYCDRCEGEFYREPLDWEIANAKKLGILK